ncbi:helix-turn-helix domain-containing protein [Pelagibacterium lacus]|uniref:AraC family transcriptional regulator n=1 Tax=Pelagibacterium lacus TaxID=2282655 RepID=A0A369WAB1_9HYPH|nr:AraC family transcriptional regulator [Pelagibacterium lacus]RDE09001.1 AraC family transcriptional regulator [Pelagibacterium lacus]
MRAYLERLPHSSTASWTMLNRRLEEAIPFQWHHHPEFELTLTLNSEGQRFIGDHVGSYGHADLVLVGPNLPHTWASRRKIDAAEPHVALVLWFRKAWIEAMIAGSVELQPVKELIDRSLAGLAFSPETGRALTAEFQALFDRPPLQRLLGLFAILAHLAGDESARPLSRAVPRHIEGRSSRLDRVLTHLHRHYAEPTSMGELAEVAALSVSGLHRMFTRQTQASITEYVAGLRIGEACSRLSATTEPIGFIAEAVGYPSLANFNRQFKALRGMTPRAYRALFRKPV